MTGFASTTLSMTTRLYVSNKVRPNEKVWLRDEDLLDATDPSFRNAIIYDTDYSATPVVKK